MISALLYLRKSVSSADNSSWENVPDCRIPLWPSADDAPPKAKSCPSLSPGATLSSSFQLPTLLRLKKARWSLKHNFDLVRAHQDSQCQGYGYGHKRRPSEVTKRALVTVLIGFGLHRQQRIHTANDPLIASERKVNCSKFNALSINSLSPLWSCPKSRDNLPES